MAIDRNTIATTTSPAPAGLARRAFLAAAATAAPALGIASVPALSAAPALPEGDARLVELGRQMEVLWQREVALNAESKRVQAELDRIEPPRPDVLRWRGEGEPVGYEEPGKDRVLWCSRADIRRLSQEPKPQTATSEFIGTPADWNGLTVRAKLHAAMGWPVEGTEHLFKSIPLKVDAAREAREAELVEAYDQWCSAVDAARELSGSTASEKAIAELGGEMSDLLFEMLNIEPTTLEGYKAIAWGILTACYARNLKFAFNEFTDQIGFATILCRLTGQQNPFADDGEEIEA